MIMILRNSVLMIPKILAALEERYSETGCGILN